MASSSSRGPQFCGFFTRNVLGIALLTHAAAKFGAFGGAGLNAFADTLARAQIPYPWLAAWAVAILELLAGLALVIGTFHRASASVALAILAGALWIEHSHAWFVQNGGAEYVVALMALAVTVYVHGPGAYAWRVEFQRTSRS